MNTYKDFREDSLSKAFGILEREVSSSLMVARLLSLITMKSAALVDVGISSLPMTLMAESYSGELTFIAKLIL